MKKITYNNVKYICQECNETHEYIKSSLSMQKKLFCDPCKRKRYKESIATNPAVPNKCRVCGKTTKKYNAFTCGKLCYGRYKSIINDPNRLIDKNEYKSIQVGAWDEQSVYI